MTGRAEPQLMVLQEHHHPNLTNDLPHPHRHPDDDEDDEEQAGEGIVLFDRISGGAANVECAPRCVNLCATVCALCVSLCVPTHLPTVHL